VLEHQIETKLYQRQGKAISNFDLTLPQPQSDLAQQLIKDPYTFDFLTLSQNAQERDLEKALLERIRSFLLELGTGFAFVSSQYHLEVGGDDFYIDLLFYHLKLRCYIVIDLKTTNFKPEYSGKMSFYVSVVDDLLRHPDDKPTIGIILCKSRNQIVAEYALRDVNKPIAVSQYKQELPEFLLNVLPSIEQLEAELATVEMIEMESNDLTD
jgi:predicted nuclease of restriction endonuclease-like (RecB) superfamily